MLVIHQYIFLNYVRITSPDSLITLQAVRRVNSSTDDGDGNQRRVKVAVFETVVSLPGIRFPFEDLVSVCKEEGVLRLIDAAHAVGMIHIDLGRLRPDFFTSNCHKEVLLPPSVSFSSVLQESQSSGVSESKFKRCATVNVRLPVQHWPWERLRA